MECEPVEKTNVYFTFLRNKPTQHALAWMASSLLEIPIPLILVTKPWACSSRLWHSLVSQPKSPLTLQSLTQGNVTVNTEHQLCPIIGANGKDKRCADISLAPRSSNRMGTKEILIHRYLSIRSNVVRHNKKSQMTHPFELRGGGYHLQCWLSSSDHTLLSLVSHNLAPAGFLTMSPTLYLLNRSVSHLSGGTGCHSSPGFSTTLGTVLVTQFVIHRDTLIVCRRFRDQEKEEGKEMTGEKATFLDKEGRTMVYDILVRTKEGWFCVGEFI